VKWGIVGYGSIGKRHAVNILSLGDDVVVLTKNTECPVPTVNTIQELLDGKIDLVIIANETILHICAYQEIRKLNKDIKILIEKPIFEKNYFLENDQNTYVAYCLRFHPLVKIIKKHLEGKKLLSAFFYVGQYLPDWRKGRDYRQVYSAHKAMGGGVLRDLSHELDLAAFFAGQLKLNYAVSKKISGLEIDTDDIYSGLFSAVNCSLININLNYLDRISQRFFIIITNAETIRVDFLDGTIKINETMQTHDYDRNEMYVEMLKTFKSDKRSLLCTFDEGQKITELIEASERK
jgi:predicted dehydrogenase